MTPRTLERAGNLVYSASIIIGGGRNLRFRGGSLCPERFSRKRVLRPGLSYDVYSEASERYSAR
jgi:hypothetical protein